MAVRPATANTSSVGTNTWQCLFSFPVAARCTHARSLMREMYEFRIPEEQAAAVLGPNAGVRVGGFIKKVTIRADDPLLGLIRDSNAAMEELGSSFFLGWRIHRQYTQEELRKDELFCLFATSIFEPPGELCGTEYDESKACPFCGVGRIQVSDLYLDPRKFPKSSHIARTIADEWVVSQRLAELLTDAAISGFALSPVRHRGYYHEDPIDLASYPAGRELISRAAAAGVLSKVPRENALPPDAKFWIWLNRPEQRALNEQLDEQYATDMRRREKRRFRSVEPWYQLVLTANPVSIVPPTRCGIHPFDDDVTDEYRCPHGHVCGLNLLSEVWVDRSQWDGSDFCVTREMIGARRGLLVPAPLILISP